MKIDRPYLPIVYRDSQAGWMSGVCAGIGEVAGIRPILLRISFLLAGYLFPLVVFPAYLIALGLLRDRSREPLQLEESVRAASVSTDYSLLQRRLVDLEAEVTSGDAELRRRFREAGLT